jgi:hypothetical protein
MIIKFSTILLLAGNFLACTDKNMQQPLPESAQREFVNKDSNSQPIIDNGVFEQKGNKQMQVKLGQYSFNLPSGWRDTSSYIYKAKDQKRALTVSFGKTRDSISLEQLVSQRRQEMVDVMGDEVEFISQEKGIVSTLPAIYLSFRFGDQNKQYREYWAIALYGDNKYLLVSYVGPQEDESFGVEFKHIVATSLPASQPEPEQVTAQYVWRQAHILRFQTPIELSAPRHYTYVSSNGITLKASFYNPEDRWPDNSLEDDAAKDLRFGGTPGETQYGIFGDLTIQQLGYAFQGGDPLEPLQFKAHRAQVAGFDGRLYLFAKGYESQTKQIDEFWQKLMASLVVGSKQTKPAVAAGSSDEGSQL